MTGRKVTRADVARQAGVSTAVVSYSMNNGPKNTAPETKARVLEAARALGYTPNASARALRRGTTDMLGLIVIDNRIPFFAQLTHAIEIAARRRGYSLFISNVDDVEADAARLIRGLASRQVDGMLIAAPAPPTVSAELLSAGVPAVLLHQFAPLEGFTTIGTEFYEGARLGVNHLVMHGYQRIGFVGGPDIDDQRSQGWADAVEAAGLRRGPRLEVDFSRAGGFEAGQALLKLPALPDAVFVSSDEQAIGLLSALHEAGVNVPKDVGIVAFDGLPEGQFSWPSLTSVRQPIDEMANAAIDRLLDKDGVTSIHLRFPTSLIIRSSCGCEASPLLSPKSAA
jgi:LacI family transcriptional regulator